MFIYAGFVPSYVDQGVRCLLAPRLGPKLDFDGALVSGSGGTRPVAFWKAFNSASVLVGAEGLACMVPGVLQADEPLIARAVHSMLARNHVFVAFAGGCRYLFLQAGNETVSTGVSIVHKLRPRTDTWEESFHLFNGAPGEAFMGWLLRTASFRSLKTSPGYSSYQEANGLVSRGRAFMRGREQDHE